MNVLDHPQSVHNFDLETLLSQAHRCRDLLTGAKAWLVGNNALGAASASNSVLEARAQLDGIVHALESLAAVEREAKHAEQRTTSARALHVMDEALRREREELAKQAGGAQ